MNVIRDVPLFMLSSENNVRSVDANDPAFAELVDSMATNGQMVEIRVYQGQDCWVTVAGHRRVAAARALGWTHIRAVIEEQPAQDYVLIEQYIENEHRQNMNLLEKARVYEHLRLLGMSQKDIATRLGKSPSEISVALSLLRAAPAVQDAVNSGKLSASAIEPLISLSQEDQECLLPAALEAKTVKKISALVKTHNTLKTDVAVGTSNDLKATVLNQLDNVLNEITALAILCELVPPSEAVAASVNDIVNATQYLKQIVE